jgi:hypothetical protein
MTQEIRELLKTVCDSKDPEQARAAVQELRKALEQHIKMLRKLAAEKLVKNV